MGFITTLETAFAEHRNPENGFAMAKYMRNHFAFFGIKTEERRRILKAVWKENQEEVSKNARTIAMELYEKPEREFQYCAVEILIQQLKGNYTKDDAAFIEKLICSHSWWDTVDFLAKYLLGNYLLQFPLETEKVISRFSKSTNLWLNRSALLFQLGYKQRTNFELLFSECLRHRHSNEFFIQKAIGWALREYAKTDPEAVIHFVSQSDLKPLSQKEALKNVVKT